MQAIDGNEYLCEHWDSACDNMPQDYLNAFLAQVCPPKPQHDPNQLDSIQKWTAVEAKNFGRRFPREGQPSFDAPLIEWYREHKIRIALFIKECEQHFTEATQ